MPIFGRKFVRFQSSDGILFDVSEQVVEMCPTAKHLLLKKRTWFRNALGGSVFSIEGSHVILKKEGRILASLLHDTPEEAIVTLPEVSGEALDRVLAFCNVSIDSGITEDCHDHHPDCNAAIPRDWENEAMSLEQGLLCELASAAYYLDIKPLVNLTSRIIASKISGKSTEELRETFADLSVDGDGLDIDVSSVSTRLRLQRKLASQKRTPEHGDTQPADKVTEEDPRTVDEILKYIDGAEPDGKRHSGSASEAKRLKRKKKREQEKLKLQQEETQRRAYETQLSQQRREKELLEERSREQDRKILELKQEREELIEQRELQRERDRKILELKTEREELPVQVESHIQHGQKESANTDGDRGNRSPGTTINGKDQSHTGVQRQDTLESDTIAGTQTLSPTQSTTLSHTSNTSPRLRQEKATKKTIPTNIPQNQNRPPSTDDERTAGDSSKPSPINQSHSQENKRPTTPTPLISHSHVYTRSDSETEKEKNTHMNQPKPHQLQLPPDVTKGLSDRAREHQAVKYQTTQLSADEVEWAESDEENLDVSPELRAAVDKEVEDFRRRLQTMGPLSGTVS